MDFILTLLTVVILGAVFGAIGAIVFQNMLAAIIFTCIGTSTGQMVAFKVGIYQP